ncbi:hypothetical protein B0T26DRAFT_757509 [Lasiosphaeria miniovina]|uniref:Uncharacterized protein n=1 Tax=Lasiosphaeria miniovina TaxID=1954250 RepID=A0AA40DHR4_9PEZI|nr:uncharacterized protein B0T26DRAFT_757509 [Lasiosphaeria miniovina]KAK0704014.1 hypothetical protein B0T26DRAFT_757509 [Lasiosphaeria miniovina]
MSHSTQSQGPYTPRGVKGNPILIDSSSAGEIVEDTDMDEEDDHAAKRGRNTIRGVDGDAIELFSRREGLVSLDAMIAALTHGTDNETNEFIAEGNEEFYALASALDYAGRDDSDAAVNQDLSTDESVLVSYEARFRVPSCASRLRTKYEETNSIIDDGTQGAELDQPAAAILREPARKPTHPFCFATKWYKGIKNTGRRLLRLPKEANAPIPEPANPPQATSSPTAEDAARYNTTQVVPLPSEDASHSEASQDIPATDISPQSCDMDRVLAEIEATIQANAESAAAKGPPSGEEPTEGDEALSLIPDIVTVTPLQGAADMTPSKMPLPDHAVDNSEIIIKVVLSTVVKGPRPQPAAAPLRSKQVRGSRPQPHWNVAHDNDDMFTPAPEAAAASSVALGKSALPTLPGQPSLWNAASPGEDVFTARTPPPTAARRIVARRRGYNPDPAIQTLKTRADYAQYHISSNPFWRSIFLGRYQDPDDGAVCEKRRKLQHRRGPAGQ